MLATCSINTYLLVGQCQAGRVGDLEPHNGSRQHFCGIRGCIGNLSWELCFSGEVFVGITSGLSQNINGSFMEVDDKGTTFPV